MTKAEIVAKMREARESHRQWAEYLQGYADRGETPSDAQNVGSAEEEREWVATYDAVLIELGDGER